MNRPKKFPTILLCFTLILAVFISGITKPGFLLPLFTPREPTVQQTDSIPVPPLQLTGNSRAFSLDPEPGVRVYAGENALDRDREFNIARLSDDLMDQYYREFEDSPDPDIMLLGGWDVDAGIGPDEFMPVGFSMDFDLKQFGLPEELYENVVVYRRDAEGLWYEYATRLAGSILSIDSRQNCPITIGLSLVASKLLTAAVYLSPIIATKYLNDTGGLQLWSNPLWFMEEYPVYLEYSSEEAADRFDRRYSLSGYLPFKRKIGTVKFRATEVDAIINEQISIRTQEITKGECKTESFLKEVEDIAKLNYGANYTKEQYNQVYAVLRKSALLRDDKYCQLVKQQQDYLKNRSITLPLIEKMKEIYVTAYKYLDIQTDLRMPSYNVDVYVTSVDNNFTYTTYPFGYAYVVVDIKGLGTNRKATDDLLVTLTHELTHVCQREYCTSTLSCLKFDESTATLMEKYSAKYYFQHGIIEQEYEPRNGSKWGFLACELDEYKYKTQLKASADITSGRADSSECSYPYCQFVDYLIGKDYPGDSLSWNRIFSAYNSWSHYIDNYGIIYFSALLKAAFPSVSTDEDLTKQFTYFAKKNKVKFYEYARADKGKYFSPTAGLEDKNGARTKIQNQNYTIKVRFLTPTKKAGMTDSTKVAMLITQEAEFVHSLADHVFVPVGITNVETLRGGIFYPPETFSKYKDQAAILEIDGGTLPPSATKSLGEYRLWTLYAPDKVTPEKKNQQIRIKMPEMSDAAKEGHISGYRVTITPSRGGTKKEFHWGIGIAGKYVSVNYSDVLDQDFMKSIRSGAEKEETVNFRVSVCEYIEDGDLTKHYGPESDEDDLNALLEEMGAHDGRITITLHWRSTDDLDLHCITPKGGHIYYGHKNADGGYLDVDMNVHGESSNAIEHIYFDTPEQGEYSVYIDNYKDRTEGDVTADLIVAVERQELMRKSVSMGGSSPTWKFKIGVAPSMREGIEYYVGSVVETSDGDRLDG